VNRPWIGAARIGVCGVAFVAAGESCQSVAPPAGLAAPINACPEHACTAYTAAGGAPASCVDGACAVPQSASSLVMVIGLSQDSGFAPGRTFTVFYDQLAASPATPQSANTCDAGGCAALPNVATPSGQYVVAPSVAQPFPLGVGWSLGNKSYTGLPVQVTYRLQWQPSATSVATVDAQSLGLPVPAVQAGTLYNQYINYPPPGSLSTGLGGILYQTYLQAGVYERIMTPTAPFNQAFPPAIEVLSVVPGTGTDQSPVNLDSTMWTTGEATIPAFDITSFAGPMDGWSAYLRDNTGLTVSNVVALSGTESPQVVLATAHVPPTAPMSMADALFNTTLVVAPPEGTPMPTEVFTPKVQQLPAAESYPALPAPVTVTGTVTTTGGVAAPAQIVFEALAIAVTSSQGTNVLNTSNFEFTGYANAAVDAAGTASYSVVLPQGTYRASVRPLTTANQVTVVDPVVIDGTAGAGGGPNFTVDVPRSAQGTALVADGRPLAGATVDLLPVGCGVDGGTSTWCLPRPVQAPTGNDGSFQLSVDPGAFLLRVKPADGSRLPWMVQTFSIAPDSPPMVIPPVNVPAPTPVGLSLYDPGGNALIHAVVRAFWLPNAGSAVELGNALTDVDGRYDMYLALPSQ
jgi:hypothetical protein